MKYANLLPAEYLIRCSKGNSFTLQVNVQREDLTPLPLSGKTIYATAIGLKSGRTINFSLAGSDYPTGKIVIQTETVELNTETYGFSLYWIDENNKRLNLIGCEFIVYAPHIGVSNPDKIDVTLRNVASGDIVNLQVLGYGGTSGGSVPGTGNTAIQELLIGTVNGFNSVFTTPSSFVPGQISVFVNGLLQTYGTDFTTSGSTTVNFTVPPETGDILVALYEVA